MIFLTFLCQHLSINSQIIDKTIYLIQGEEYKVNLDSIFKEEKENIYSFQSDNKGFTLDTSSLKLKSDQGTYSIKPTKILRERQLIDLEDYQGLGQFGILDQHDSGHRICYNSDAIITIDQCIELDNTATSYDFVFIDRNTIAVSKVRVADQQFGVTIYKNKELVSELYFVPSKTYTQIDKTIIEYAIFGKNKYLLFGVTAEDSNIEFLEIQDNLEIVNTNNVIEKSLFPKKQAFQVYDIKGTSNKVYVICQSSNEAKLVVYFTFSTKWSLQGSFELENFRGLELGYSFIQYYVAQTYLSCSKDSYSIISTENQQIKLFQNLSQEIKRNAQVRFTLNYVIVLQDNTILVSTLQKTALKTDTIQGTLQQIDVDFQNDILIAFTDSKIMTYYLKQTTLSYSSNTITKSLDQVTIQAVSGENQQIAKINFQVLSKQDYSLYELKDLTQDLYYSQVIDSTQFDIPLQGISGADIKIVGKLDSQVEINYFPQYELNVENRRKQSVIQEQLVTSDQNPYIFRQYHDNSTQIFECRLSYGVYLCDYSVYQDSQQKQKVILQYFQIGENKQFALLDEDGLKIKIVQGQQYQINAQEDNKFVDMKMGKDRLFVYTTNYSINFYQFKGQLIGQLDLTQFGQPQGEIIQKLWVNQVKTNLLVITYGEDLIIGRFTTQFIFIQRITIKWVVDIIIIAENKLIVLSTDKTSKKLTQYILKEGKFTIQRELDPHGYIITGNQILSDYVFGEIIIQAEKNQSVLLAFGDTELERDSLLEVIQLQQDEFPGNVIYNQQKSRLLIRSTDSNKNSTMMDLNYTHETFDIHLTKIPNKFSQQLDLKYIYNTSFSSSKVEKLKKFYLEYQFQNITVKQVNSKISHGNEQLNISITDTFSGQIESIYLTNQDDNIKLTKRFEYQKELSKFPQVSTCKQVVSFGRIICIGGSQITYHDMNSELLSQSRVDLKIVGNLINMTLHNDDQYALIRSEQGLVLAHISLNEIKLSQTFYESQIQLQISIFYKVWLVLYDTQLSYYKFQKQENDSWSIEKYDDYTIQGVKAIQYDPVTEQIIYQTGDQNLYYFRSSLEGDSIQLQNQYICNIPKLLKSYKIYQPDPRIQHIKIITISLKKSYILVSTSYGNIWNMTIKSNQDFSMNNMYIVNRKDPQVEDIQLIDNFMIVQNPDFQTLYNTKKKSLDQPGLGLEVALESNITGLFKNGSQIILITSRGGVIYTQYVINDEVFITINNLTSISNLSIYASNGYRNISQANYILVQSEKSNNTRIYVWVATIITVAIIVLIGLIYYKRQQRVETLIPLENIINE